MRWHHHYLFTIGVSALALLIASAASAATSQGNDHVPFATERLENGQLTLEVEGSFGKADLTLYGPGRIKIRKSFGSGEAISIPLVGADGSPLPDGRYRYSVQISPRRRRGTGFKSGVFYIRNGEAFGRQDHHQPP